MIKPTPTQQEVPFKVDEMFFSITNSRGTIQAGNDVFYRISGYHHDEMIGQPHSIVRHPDMPKTVFRLFWDYLKAGKTVSAYVKNMAKDGSYYWVIATAFPVGERFVSIRFKPTSPCFDRIKEVYQKVQAAEKVRGMDDGHAVLLAELKSLGFDGYDSFMISALSQELKSRERLLTEMRFNDHIREFLHEAALVAATNQSHGELTSLTQLIPLCLRIRENYQKLFGKTELFFELNQVLAAKSKFVRGLAHEIGMLSMNASIEASRTGMIGASLSMVANEMRTRAEDAKKRVNSINQAARPMRSEIRHVEFQVSLATLHVEMLKAFLLSLCRMNCSSSNQCDSKESEEETRFMIEFLRHSSNEAIQSTDRIAVQLEQLTSLIEKLEAVMMTLEVVRKTGLIESARIGKNGQNFVVLFEQMISSVDSAKKELVEFREAVQKVRKALRETENMDIQVTATMNKLASVFDSLMRLKERGRDDGFSLSA